MRQIGGAFAMAMLLARSGCATILNEPEQSVSGEEAIPELELPGVTKANFDRIEKGMTKAEVREIFGGNCWRVSCGGGGLSTPEQCLHAWKGQNGRAMISFDDFGENAKVANKYWRYSDESFFANIRHWLHPD